MSEVLSRLDAEWQCVASSPAARRALARWAVAHPPLRGLADLDELLERRRDPEKAPDILAALAALAATDELAARTLLKALVPGLVRLSTTAGFDHWDAIDEMLSLAWERIRTYPTDRPGTVAGNVLLDVKKRYRLHRRIDAPRSTMLRPSLILPPVDADMARSAEDEAIDRVAFDEFLALQRRIVGDRGLRAVVSTRVAERSLEEVAAEENISVQTLYVRRIRAEQQLARQQQLSQLARAG